jgi:exopolysaccharide biosynthesis polyprenyl glycosylphosphotransferase
VGDDSVRSDGITRGRKTRVRRRFTLTTAFVLSDTFAILAAALTATYLRAGAIDAPIAFENATLHVAFWQLAVFIVPVWIGLLAVSGLYDRDRITWGITAVGLVARSLSFGVVALILATFLAKTPGLSRGWMLIVWIASIVFVLFLRSILVSGLMYERSRGRMQAPTLIVGCNAESLDILRVLRGNPAAGLRPIAAIASTQTERLALDHLGSDLPVIGTARDIVTIVDQTAAETVVIASTAFDHEVVARIVADLRVADVDVHVSPGLFEVLTRRVLITEIAGLPLITIKGISLSRWNLAVKRTFDLSVAFVIVVLGLPVWAAIALAIRLTSPGPIFYAQERVGRDGAPFPMVKFRSMYLDSDQRLKDLIAGNEATGPIFKMKDDPRVTPVGKWLRKLSFDEFPQLLNVLHGEMSLVGPRPPLPREVERYSAHDWRRLEVVPGMTGLWQVSGRSSLTFDEMVRLDILYIENWSVGLDVTLIFRTIPAVLLARGAY